MEVGRIAVGLGFFGMAIWAFFSFTAVPETITFHKAELHPMARGFAVVGQIQNGGAADRLVGIASDAAGRAMLMGGENITIPRGATPTLAMDGAHGMLMDVQGDVAEGRLIPVTLWFENAGRVSTRAKMTTGMMMDHNQAYEVPEGEPKPNLSISVEPDGNNFTVNLDTSDFTFSEDSVDGPHQPGVGHAHLYLNGLKLTRMYGPNAQIGALPSGQYLVSVSLNTNDHQVYSVDGRVMVATATLTVD